MRLNLNLQAGQQASKLTEANGWLCVYARALRFVQLRGLTLRCGASQGRFRPSHRASIRQQTKAGRRVERCEGVLCFLCSNRNCNWPYVALHARRVARRPRISAAQEAPHKG